MRLAQRRRGRRKQISETTKLRIRRDVDQVVDILKDCCEASMHELVTFHS